jgi:hypothetical protein
MLIGQQLVSRLKKKKKDLSYSRPVKIGNEQLYFVKRHVYSVMKKNILNRQSSFREDLMILIKANADREQFIEDQNYENIERDYFKYGRTEYLKALQLLEEKKRRPLSGIEWFDVGIGLAPDYGMLETIFGKKALEMDSFIDYDRQGNIHPLLEEFSTGDQNYLPISMTFYDDNDKPIGEHLALLLRKGNNIEIFDASGKDGWIEDGSPNAFLDGLQGQLDFVFGGEPLNFDISNRSVQPKFVGMACSRFAILRWKQQKKSMEEFYDQFEEDGKLLEPLYCEAKAIELLDGLDYHTQHLTELIERAEVRLNKVERKLANYNRLEGERENIAKDIVVTQEGIDKTERDVSEIDTLTANVEN